MIATILAIALLTIGLGVLTHVIDAALALYYLFTLDPSDYRSIAERTGNRVGLGFTILWRRLRSRGPKTNAAVNAHHQAKANGQKRRANYAQRRAQLRMRRQLADNRMHLIRVLAILSSKTKDPMPDSHPVAAALRTPMFINPTMPTGPVILEVRLYPGFSSDAIAKAGFTEWETHDFMGKPLVFPTASDALMHATTLRNQINQSIDRMNELDKDGPRLQHLRKTDFRLVPYAPAPAEETPTEQPRTEEPETADIKI